MATTMIGRSSQLFKVISGIRHLQILHIHKPESTQLKRLIWSGTILARRSKENESSDKSAQKPKMPPNAFIMFMQTVEQKIKNDNPNLNRTELVKQASKMWHELDPEEKSRIALARKIQFDKYKENLRIYTENMTPEQIKIEESKKEKAATKKLKRIRVELGMPKKPLGSFSLFVSEKYAEQEGTNVQTNFKQLIDEWAKMSDVDKNPYRQKARTLKEKYDEEMAKWEKEMIALGRFDVVRKSLLTKLSMAKRGSKRRTKNKVGFSAHESEDSDL